MLIMGIIGATIWVMGVINLLTKSPKTLQVGFWLWGFKVLSLRV